MKIKKRVSLHHGLQRMQEPSRNGPWFHRFTYKFHNDHHINPRLELMKYGYRSKTQNKWTFFWYLSLFSFGVFLNNYLMKLYQNQLQTIYPYRYIQQQHSPLWMKARIFFAHFFSFISNQLFLQEIIEDKTQKLKPATQSQLRYLQYENYMKKRNDKFDFVDIGVLEKFPYPKINKIEF